QRRGARVVIACPAYVYGPGDAGPGGRFISDLLRGRVPALVSETAWFSFVHVDDAVEGLVRVGDSGRIGAVYVLSGEALSFHDWVRAVAAAAGAKVPPLRIPATLARTTGRLLDRVSRTTGWRFPLTAEGIELVARGRWLHPHDRATRELGWTPRSVAEGLPETVAWFRAKQARS
ncbi:MAG TPA: NAD-dependent epimerase/dehydratase family protein, partial [Planctomycetota bacterium]|nr:NAD-dependent epimerase/dehydratase family protein [Planctomycetota bacterium]